MPNIRIVIICFILISPKSGNTQQQYSPEFTKIYTALVSATSPEEKIKIYEAIPAGSSLKKEVEDYYITASQIADAYGKVGNKAMQEKLQPDPMKMVEALGEDSESGAYLKKLLGASAQMQQQQTEQKNAKAIADSLEETGQLTSVKRRLNINASDEYDKQLKDAMEGNLKFMETMLDAADLTEEEKAEYEKLLGASRLVMEDNENIGGAMAIVAEYSGVDEEEQRQNALKILKEQKKYFPDLVGDFDENSSLEDLYAALNNTQRSVKKMSDRHLNKTMNRLYNPSSIITTYEPLEKVLAGMDWMQAWHFKILRDMSRVHQEHFLSSDEFVSLFLKRLLILRPGTPPTEVSTVQKKLPETMKNIQKYMAIQTASAMEGYQEMFSGDYLEQFSDFAMSTVQTADVLGHFNEDVDEYAPQIKGMLAEYKRAKDILDLDEIGELTYDVNQLEEMAKYRDISLNIALKFLKEGILDPFKDPNDMVGPLNFSLNGIIASKGADYRARTFIRDGVRKLEGQKRRYKELRKKKAQLGLLHQSLDPEELEASDFREDLMATRKSEKELYFEITQNTNFASFASRFIITWQEIQKLLKPHEAFVDVERIEDLEDPKKVAYLLFIVRKNEAPQYVIIEDARKIEGEYRAFSHRDIALSNPPPQRAKYSDTKPYQWFWKPLEPHLNEIKRVFLSADGIYHTFNPEAFLLENGEDFLFSKVEVVKLSEIANIRERNIDRPFRSTGKITLFGNPSYEQMTMPSAKAADELRLYKGSKLTPLETEKEINQILAGAKKSVTGTTYLGDRATESQLLGIRKPGILHIATHGVFPERFNRRQYNEKGAKLGVQYQKFMENPFLRSYITFSGASNTLTGTQQEGANDGIVSAEDIVHMDFTGTQLVVLSACQTGQGEQFDGEGIFGLQRSFLDAGANVTLTSLWKISDDATIALMTRFYKELLIGDKSPRQAFRIAQNALKADYPHPYFWAPFILVEG